MCHFISCQSVTQNRMYREKKVIRMVTNFWLQHIFYWRIASWTVRAMDKFGEQFVLSIK